MTNSIFIWPDSPPLLSLTEADSERREAEAASLDWLDYTPEECEQAVRELEIEYGHEGVER